MPIRIYALAKELKVDSKDLVDICVKAGVSGKGSALASLEDDEVAKVKVYLANPKKGGKSADAAATAHGTATAGGKPGEVVAMTREETMPPAAPAGKIKVIDTKSKKAAAVSTATPAAPAEVAVPVVEVPVAAPAAVAPLGKKPAATPLAAPGTVTASTETQPPVTGVGTIPAVPPVIKADGSATKAPPERQPPQSQAPIRPVQPFMQQPPIPMNRSVPIITSQTPKSASSKPLPPKNRAPVINLAKLPDVKQPVHQPQQKHEKAQRPDIRLPVDVIKGVKAGGARPPLNQIAQAQNAANQKPGDRPRPKSTMGQGGAAGSGGQNRSGGGSSQKPGGGGGGGSSETPLGKAVRKQAKTGPGSGPGSEKPEGERKLAGMANARIDRQKSRQIGKIVKVGPDGKVIEEEESVAARRARRLTRRGKGTNTAAPRKEKVGLQLPCSVREFSEASGVGAGQILKTLLKMGQMANINATISQELGEVLAIDLGLDLDISGKVSFEDSVLTSIDDQNDDPALLEPRAPIVTFLGHVDHGKTSLLDRIIGINVAAKEAGGITQHIRAYQITKDGRKISFVDTPGHEAFTEMRARGANVTDIAVLVVAADDGVMPQTEEAISHAKAAEVPIVVALNKMDLPGANPDRVLQQLAAQGLMPSEWSGDVEVIRCSAATGKGMDELLETLLVTADLHEFKANPHRDASGTCLEAEQQPGRGVIAKVMVQNGTLKVGDIVVCGPAHGRVKAMYDTLKTNVMVKQAGPSMPVNLTGLDIAPNAGDKFIVLNDITQARELAASRATQSRETSLSGSSMKVSFDQFQKMLSEGKVGDKVDVVELNLIVRADVRGSIEAILKELSKLDHPEVKIKILQASVGGITVADVTLAAASNAVIVGFNVIPDEAARTLAEQKQVEIRRYDIIYKVADDIKSLLEGKLKPEEKIVDLGQAIVKQVFSISRVGVVAGCYVSRGTIERGARIRVFRDGRLMGEYPLESLRREKDDSKEVQRGMECGIRLAGFSDIKKDDILEAYKIQEVARTL